MEIATMKMVLLLLLMLLDHGSSFEMLRKAKIFLLHFLYVLCKEKDKRSFAYTHIFRRHQKSYEDSWRYPKLHWRITKASEVTQTFSEYIRSYMNIFRRHLKLNEHILKTSKTHNDDRRNLKSQKDSRSHLKLLTYSEDIWSHTNIAEYFQSYTDVFRKHPKL